VLMAKEYLEKLSVLVERLRIRESFGNGSIEVKHFFSGAALYANGNICVSWSPVGIAFKLSECEVAKLVESKKGKPLKYFPKGNVKKGYVLFESPESSEPERWKPYFSKSIKLCAG